MKIFGGGVAPDNFVNGLTATYALGMTTYCTVRDASETVRERARSWFESGESVDRGRLFSRYGMAASVSEGARFAARNAVSYMASRSVWIDHFTNDPLAMLQMCDALAASILNGVTRVLYGYAASKAHEHEEAHRTEGA